MSEINNQLIGFINNIEHLENEKKEISEQITAVYSEIKSAGYDIKIVKLLIAMRKKDINSLMEEETLIELYKKELGMI